MSRIAILGRSTGLAFTAALLLGACSAAPGEPEPEPGTTWREPATGMEFVWVPSGCFEMGFPEINESGSHPDREYEQPQHRVCVPGFHLGKYEVTQAEYEKVMGANPSLFRHDLSPRAPVDNMSWNDAVAMAAKLDPDGGIRLPTEAEWEYACRAGGSAQGVCGGSDAEVNALAWNNKYKPRPQPVGGKRPNAWGLYDMSGNVWELTQDCWHPNYRNAPGDGSAWNDEGDCGHRAKRGGDWESGEVHATVRSWSALDTGSEVVGFRLVHVP